MASESENKPTAVSLEPLASRPRTGGRVYEAWVLTAFAVDGDTLNCLIDRGWNDWSNRKLRVEGVQAPEINSKNFGGLERQAAAAVKECVDRWARRHIGDGLKIHSSKWDKYNNRVLGDLIALPSSRLTPTRDPLDVESLKLFLLSHGLAARWNGEGWAGWLEITLRGILDRATDLLAGKPIDSYLIPEQTEQPEVKP